MLGSTVATEAPPRIAPVIIDNGADGAPDSVRVMFSGQGNFAVPIAVVPPAGAGTIHEPAATAFVLRSNVNLGNAQGDLMMAVHVPADPAVAPSCTLFSLNMNGLNPLLRDAAGNETEDVGNPLGILAAGTRLYEGAAPVGGVRVGPRLGHVADNTPSGVWNGDGATPLFPVSLDGPGPAGPNAYLINLGRPAEFVYRTYSINTTGMAMRVFDATNGSAATQDLYGGIVNLQAVYGKALGTDPTRVTAWNAADPALDITDSAGNTINGWSRVVSVRLALVARSQQYEKAEVTAVQPSWRPNGVDAETLKVDGNTDWKHYRYKVYETVVPLRNMIWQS
jgi:type IV pilus assembly protein PilW